MDITIEKVRRDFLNSGEYEYRVRLIGTPFNMGESFRTSGSGDPEELLYMVEMAIRRIFDNVARRFSERTRTRFEHTRDIDTGIEREHEMQRQFMMRQMSVSPLNYTTTAGNRFALPSYDFPWGEDSWGEKAKPNPKEEKAMQLLKEKIGDIKYKNLTEQGYFTEQGKEGIYRFFLNDSSGVRLIKEIDFQGKKRPLEWTLCIQSSVSDMPKGDVILSRWMEFKTDEAKFLKTANFRQVKTTDEAIGR